MESNAFAIAGLLISVASIILVSRITVANTDRTLVAELRLENSNLKKENKELKKEILDLKDEIFSLYQRLARRDNEES